MSNNQKSEKERHALQRLEKLKEKYLAEEQKEISTDEKKLGDPKQVKDFKRFLGCGG